VRDVPLKLIDTAGIRETDDKVEKIGVERSKQAITQADLVLLILNNSEALTDEDRTLLAATQDKKRLVILNKTDLPVKLDEAELQQTVAPENIIAISALTATGVDQLEQRIADLFWGGIDNSQSTTLVSNARQIGLLNQAKQALDDVLAGIKAEMPVDLVQIDMTRCWDLLGEITGDAYQDELLNQLFSQFCLGK
jgi:tRNA modification GTPase